MNLEFESKEIGAIKKLSWKEPIDTKKLFENVDFDSPIENKELIKVTKKMVEKKARQVEYVLKTQEVNEKESLEGYLETLKSIINKIGLSEVKEENVGLGEAG